MARQKQTARKTVVKDVDHVPMFKPIIPVPDQVAMRPRTSFSNPNSEFMMVKNAEGKIVKKHRDTLKAIDVTGDVAVATRYSGKNEILVPGSPRSEEVDESKWGPKEHEWAKEVRTHNYYVKGDSAQNDAIGEIEELIKAAREHHDNIEKCFPFKRAEAETSFINAEECLEIIQQELQEYFGDEGEEEEDEFEEIVQKGREKMIKAAKQEKREREVEEIDPSSEAIPTPVIDSDPKEIKMNFTAVEEENDRQAKEIMRLNTLVETKDRIINGLMQRDDYLSSQLRQAEEDLILAKKLVDQMEQCVLIQHGTIRDLRTSKKAKKDE